jgi:proton-dependent oligopeptide transporter, POT family
MSSESQPLQPKLLPILIQKVEDADLPTNVNTKEQLALLPPECLSGNPRRPLRHVDDLGRVSEYALNPNASIVLLVLIVETMERFSFYGVYYTLTLYLTGIYNDDWNAGWTAVEAASYVSLSTAVAYTTPFIGALLADSVLGDYASIVVGAALLYWPGLVLVAATTVPYLLGETFNHVALSIAVLGLWPLGTGMVKSVVNVFGARQFHPILQSSLIESYYVSFYTSINVGALVGIVGVPVLAQRNVSYAYLLPVVLLALAIVIFVAGTPYYVTSWPQNSPLSRCRKGSTSVTAKSPVVVAARVPVFTMLRISLLIVPFCVAYSQMPTTFICQGTVMAPAVYGLLDAASMNSLDAVSVLVFGTLIASQFYPALARRGIKMASTHKFATGSFLGALSLLWAVYVEYMIQIAYERDGRKISVLWQTPSYILIGIGEIFAVSAAYEVAFVTSSPQNKALASAVNIFCVGGIPNLLCIGLYRACRGWFRNSRNGTTNISHLEDYASAHVANYFWVLVGILVFGVILNIHPSVKSYVESVEKKAADIIKTPLMGRRLLNEGTPLLRKKFGDKPVLAKMGSMRAGPSLSHTPANVDAAAANHVKYSYIPRLYHQHEKHSRAPNEPHSTDDTLVHSSPSRHGSM